MEKRGEVRAKACSRRETNQRAIGAEEMESLPADVRKSNLTAETWSGRAATKRKILLNLRDFERLHCEELGAPSVAASPPQASAVNCSSPIMSVAANRRLGHSLKIQGERAHRVLPYPAKRL